MNRKRKPQMQRLSWMKLPQETGSSPALRTKGRISSCDTSSSSLLPQARKSTAGVQCVQHWPETPTLTAMLRAQGKDYWKESDGNLHKVKCCRPCWLRKQGVPGCQRRLEGCHRNHLSYPEYNLHPVAKSKHRPGLLLSKTGKSLHAAADWRSPHPSAGCMPGGWRIRCRAGLSQTPPGCSSRGRLDRGTRGSSGEWAWGEPGNPHLRSEMSRASSSDTTRRQNQSRWWCSRQSG